MNTALEALQDFFFDSTRLSLLALLCGVGLLYTRRRHKWGRLWLTVAVMAIGGRGIVSVASNAAPAEVVQIVELAAKGDFAGARRLHMWLLPFIQVNFIESNPIPVKAAMAAMGLIEEAYRLPLVPPSATHADVLAAGAAGMPSATSAALPPSSPAAPAAARRCAPHRRGCSATGRGRSGAGRSSSAR